MKKGIGFALLSLLLVLSIVGFASADPSEAIKKISADIAEFMDKVIAVANPVLTYTLGKVETAPGTTDNAILFIKFLLFIVMLSVVYLAASRTPMVKDNRTVLWIVTIVVSVLGARFLSTSQLVEFAWLPSGVVGVALTCLIPLVVYFFFIEGLDSRVMRYIGWIFFAVLFAALAWFRWEALAPSAASKIPFNLGWVYIITAVLSAIAIWQDKRIRAALMVSWLHDIAQSGQYAQIGIINTEIAWLQAVITTPVGSPFPAWTLAPHHLPPIPLNPVVRASDHTDAQRTIKSLQKSIAMLMTT